MTLPGRPPWIRPLLATWASRLLSAANQGLLLPRDTDLQRVGAATLLALLKRDPINIISCKLLDRFGMVQLSTNPTEIGKFESSLNHFLTPFQNGYPFTSPISITGNGGGIIQFSAPIRSAAGITIGVLDISYSASIFQQSIVRNSAKLGPDVSAMLLDDNNIIIAHSSAPELVYKIVNPPNNNTIYNLIYDNRLQNLPPDQLAVHMDGLTSGLKDLATTQYFTGNFHPQQQAAVASSNVDQAGAAILPTTNWHVVTYAVGKPYKVSTDSREAVGLSIYQEECSLYDGRTMACDTDYRVKERLTVSEIFERVPVEPRRVCITGGEPCMHDLSPLLTKLYSAGKHIHLETSGTIMFDSAPVFITVSPKKDCLKEMLERADEVKLLVDKGFNPDEFLVLATFKPVYLQPINGEHEVSSDNLQLCIEWQKKYPQFRVSCQLHKVIQHFIHEVVR